MTATPEVHGFFDPETATISYVVIDPATRDAALIDSVLDYEPASGRTATRSADKLVTCVADKGATVDRDRFAEALAISMVDALWTWRQEGIESIVRAWLPDGHAVGTLLRVSEQGIDGTFDGLAPDGALRLRVAGGETMLVHAGDVELRRPVEGN